MSTPNAIQNAIKHLDTLRIHDTLVIRDTVWAVDSTNRFLISDLHSFYSDNFNTLVTYTGIAIAIIAFLGIGFSALTYWFSNETARELKENINQQKNGLDKIASDFEKHRIKYEEHIKALTENLDKNYTDVTTRISSTESNFDTALAKAQSATNDITGTMNDEISVIYFLLAFTETENENWSFGIKLAFISIKFSVDGNTKYLSEQFDSLINEIDKFKFDKSRQSDVHNTINQFQTLESKIDNEHMREKLKQLITKLTQKNTPQE